MASDWDLPEYGRPAGAFQPWFTAEASGPPFDHKGAMRDQMDAITRMENPPTHVVLFNVDQWWKRILRRLHLIRRPKPFDWKAAADG